jgi:processive 1,2-diacylglycerol beta-glucosyltransferase
MPVGDTFRPLRWPFVRSRERQSPVGPGDLPRVLVISASMGAGHDGAARELAARLRATGHHAEVRDFLDSGPLRIGAALRSGYEFELKHLPGAYEATYRLWYRVPWLCPLVAWLVTALTRRKVLRWVRESAAGVVVSTYPLATLCLGRLRATRRLGIPAVNFITDFGVHPLWVHRGIDLNLAVHQGPAEMAARRTGRPSVACGPVVSEAFDPDLLPDRTRARSGLGLAPTAQAVLVVAGSWGVGGLGATWHAITSDGRFTPVVVCGRDERLRRDVTALAERSEGDSIILGWTEDMPALMAGCDALVENAGGLTSLEAMRAGLPVVSFQPIAGHGRENTARMAAAGVSRLATDAHDLIDALGALTTPGPARSAQVNAGRAMFRASAAALTIAAAGGATREPTRLRRRPAVYAGRGAAAVITIAALGWVALTSGVEVAAASVGAGVAHPAAGVSSAAYVGVRLNAVELADRTIWVALERMNLTAIVDRATAMTDPQAVRALAGLGVNVASGGRGDWSTGDGHDSDPALWTRARDDAQAGHALAQLVGTPVTVLVPGRRVNAWDLIECGAAHASLVVPNHVVAANRAAAEANPVHVTARHIYVINGLDATPVQLDAVLAQLSAGLELAHLSAVPLNALA